MPIRRGYSTRKRFPTFRAEKRIKMPQIVKRPLRFQIRSIIKREEIHKDVWWFTLHRRGPKRDIVGENPLEARAIPHEMLRGTLPERILYKALVELLHFVPDVDFDFQSSLQGGRIDTGGIVADFLFPYLKIVINPLGPTHREFLRMRKDDEQILALEEMGYTVYMIWEDEIYDEYRLDNWLRQVFGWTHSGGTGPASNYDIEQVPTSEGFTYDKLFNSVLELKDILSGHIR